MTKTQSEEMISKLKATFTYTEKLNDKGIQKEYMTFFCKYDLQTVQAAIDDLLQVRKMVRDAPIDYSLPVIPELEGFIRANLQTQIHSTTAENQTYCWTCRNKGYVIVRWPYELDCELEHDVFLRCGDCKAGTRFWSQLKTVTDYYPRETIHERNKNKRKYTAQEIEEAKNFVLNVKRRMCV